MAKQSKGKSRLRVFFADFEGDDETIQESLRAISNAVSKTFQPKIINVPQKAIQTNIEDSALESEDAEELIEYDDVGDDCVSAVSARQRKKRKAPTMSLVKELNLRPEGKKPLREFYSEKQPSSQEKKIALFVYYMVHELEVADINPNHVFTCFKHVEARPPKDLPQIIRNTASRWAWIDNADSNNIKITNHGESFVEHDLPENSTT